MTLEPYMSTNLITQIHIVTATIAVVIGPFALFRRRRDRLHKMSGYVWVIAMATAALSSFGITSFGVVGPFSPIHLLAILALWSLWVAMRAVFAGKIKTHEEAMKSLYWNGLLVAGAFQFLPGRSTNRVFFGDQQEHGYIVLALVLAAIVGRVIRRRMTIAAVSA
ncbi:DUF2306 domain-containing protein [Thalassococcus lentus]|uniref:DUF2306 domain-containing protein n=1 Tax=Thalassococcus lentus TaxID=1210524 RepID=A0ABT4XU36_9RHOB|nr:DUF2306 domain-containing protein [Thalassococcus lentus]MDA7425323.1 DUF2306 domain-containing protein [Thalassococcus lentus]